MTFEPATPTSVRYPELTIQIARQHPDVRGAYRVELSFTRPGTSAPTEPDAGQAMFDTARLNEVLNDVDEYGARLTQALFADPGIQSSFETAYALAAADQLPLRLRLQIDAGAPELHELRWETVRDLHGSSLATSEQILLSRYLRSPDWRSVRLQPESQLRALVMIASPTGLDQYSPEGAALQPLDVPGELERATQALGEIAVTSLASHGAARLDALTRELRRGYDVVYLVCHGALVNGHPRLYLENEIGNVAGVNGSELIQELAQLRQLPSLVVLASCESAGSGASGALAAIGPLLARVGVPSVLAMQGKVSVQTAQAFMEQFFVELRRDGQLDRAVAVARAEVKARPDAWMPVLFTRLSSGRLWSTPTEISDSRFRPWDALLNHIEAGQCTPVLGPGLIEFLLGSPREVANRWADRYRFPMAPQDRQDLPQVAQFLAVELEDPGFPRTELRKYLQEEMRERYGDQLPEHLRGAQLDVLVHEVWKQRREHDPMEPHHVLASLPLPIYLSTNPVDILATALSAVDKKPRVELCCWNDEIEWSSARGREDRPDEQRPLVYHLFGQMMRPESLVLTEDDYFDYLIGVTKRADLIPPPVVRAWNENVLLFLGFPVDSWSFRVLFRSIMNQEGRARGRKKPHVAVQIDPAEGGSVDPLRARQYLERYFQGEHVNIYWGSTEEFIRELWMRWQQRSGSASSVGAPLVGATS